MSRIVNLSTVYRRLPRDERALAAAADGFSRVETWWEFPSAAPAQEDVDSFLAAIEAAGVELVAINSHGGDRATGERGLASLPDRREEFELSIAAIAEMNRRTGARLFNVAAGNLVADRWSREEQLSVAAERYAWACAQVAPFGGTILIEALSADGNPEYPFRTGGEVVSFIEQRAPAMANLGLLYDTFHLASGGVDLVSAIDELAPRIRHVQLADFPGRGAPGTGDIDFEAVQTALDHAGYAGGVSLEYMG